MSDLEDSSDSESVSEQSSGEEESEAQKSDLEGSSDNESTVSEQQSCEEEESATDNDDSANRCGVIYLSRIPTRMNCKLVREYFQQFGNIGRIYLQPINEKEKPGGNKRHRRFREFSEGWVEFIDKKIARQVAETLNNQPTVSGKRKYPWSGELWNLKYLKNFKWTHLNEKMAYDKAVKAKRLRLEVGQAKKEAQFFSENLEFSKRLKRLKQCDKHSSDDEKKDAAENPEGKSDLLMNKKRRWDFKQKEPEEDKKKASKANTKKKTKKTPQKAAAQSENFLQNIFTA